MLPKSSVNYTNSSIFVLHTKQFVKILHRKINFTKCLITTVLYIFHKILVKNIKMPFYIRGLSNFQWNFPRTFSPCREIRSRDTDGYVIRMKTDPESFFGELVDRETNPTNIQPDSGGVGNERDWKNGSRIISWKRSKAYLYSGEFSSEDRRGGEERREAGEWEEWRKKMMKGDGEKERKREGYPVPSPERTALLDFTSALPTSRSNKRTFDPVRLFHST